MRNNILKILYTGCFILLLQALSAQNVNEKDSSTFYAESNDLLCIGDTEYMISESPIEAFGGYDTIYGKRGECLVSCELPMHDVKNYSLMWCVKDSLLYLIDMNFVCRSDSESKNPERLKIIEKLIGKKFEIRNFSTPNYYGKLGEPAKMISATWVSDTFYIKRFPGKEEFYLDEKYKKEPFNRLIFKNGRLVQSNIVDKMAKLESKTKIPFKCRFVEISNDNPAAQNLKPTYPQGFKGNTNDILYWHSTGYMCSESPAFSFKGYKDILGVKLKCSRKIMLPIKDDKAYEFIWLIVNDSLYLCDAHFFCSSDTSLNSDIKKYEALEKLTNQKMVALPYLDPKFEDFEYGNIRKYLSKKGVIPAVWFTGKLYVKDYLLPEIGYYGSPIERIPFVCLEFENGKIVNRDLYVKEMP